MARRRETGYGAAWARSGGAYIFAIEGYEEVRAAWMAGRAFVETRSVHGEPLTLKLAAVEAIQRYSPEGIAAARAEEAADRAEDALTGMD